MFQAWNSQQIPHCLSFFHLYFALFFMRQREGRWRNRSASFVRFPIVALPQWTNEVTAESEEPPGLIVQCPKSNASPIPITSRVSSLTWLEIVTRFRDKHQMPSASLSQMNCNPLYPSPSRATVSPTPAAISPPPALPQKKRARASHHFCIQDWVRIVVDALSLSLSLPPGSP